MPHHIQDRRIKNKLYLSSKVLFYDIKENNPLDICCIYVNLVYLL